MFKNEQKVQRINKDNKFRKFRVMFCIYFEHSPNVSFIFQTTLNIPIRHFLLHGFLLNKFQSGYNYKTLFYIHVQIEFSRVFCVLWGGIQCIIIIIIITLIFEFFKPVLADVLSLKFEW